VIRHSIRYNKRIKDKNMSTGKAFAFCFGQSNAKCSTSVDANPHVLACDYLNMEHSNMSRSLSLLGSIRCLRTSTTT
jgi:hypothetical protein